MTAPALPPTPSSPLPPAAPFRRQPDRSGAWAGAWVVVYASVATAWWGISLAALGVLRTLTDFAPKWAEMQELQRAGAKLHTETMDVIARAADGFGIGVWPFVAAGFAAAGLLAFAGGGIIARSRFARGMAAALLAGMVVLVIAYLAFTFLHVHPIRVEWYRDVEQVLADHETAGGTVGPEAREVLAMADPASSAVVEGCLQALHLGVLALLLWAVLRGGTRRWCSPSSN